MEWLIWKGEKKNEAYASGGPANSTSESAEVTAVACYRRRRLIKTKTQTSPSACVCDLPHAKNSALWNAALAKAVPLRTAAQPVWPFEVLCLANQPRRDPGPQPWLGFKGRRQMRGETHSTLINTWPHYLSHVAAESHRGKFNTALLSWGMVRRDFMCVYIGFVCRNLNDSHLYVCICVYVYLHVSIPVYFLCQLVCMCACVCGCSLLPVRGWLCVGLDSLWCQDSIKRFNIAIMRGCLILFARSLPLSAALCISKAATGWKRRLPVW